MDRDALVYKAKLAEQAERFDEMVQDMYVWLMVPVDRRHCQNPFLGSCHI